MTSSQLSFGPTWEDATVVALDTETSGAYPIGDEIVEVGAVKWRGGQVVGEFQSLIRPSRPIPDYIIKVHGITNQMVAGAPTMDEVLPGLHEFIGDAVFVAHHAPFDLGFLVYELERAGLPLPRGEIFCSSLLARALITECENHRLQTLVKALNLTAGTAHRALDDARACLGVALECFKRAGEKATLAEIAAKMGKRLSWENYLVTKSADPKLIQIADAIRHGMDIQLIYDGGTLKGVSRRITPIGLVRNPDGDFVFALCHVDHLAKRFYLAKIREMDVVVRDPGPVSG